MHSEHLRNLRWGSVALGWFIGAAMTSLAVFALLALGLLARDGTGGWGWGLLAIAVGFFAGGWFAGWRAGAAPILHGVAIGLLSLLLWLLVSVVAGAALHADRWSTASYPASILLLQMVAAAAGAHFGSRDARAASRSVS